WREWHGLCQNCPVYNSCPGICHSCHPLYSAFVWHAGIDVSPWVWRLVGVSLIALGAGINLFCGWEFAFRGKGTPAVWDPPQKLVSTGLYQYTRNPMYLGIDLLLLGEAVLFESWILLGYAILVGAGFHLFVIYYEEPTLARKFEVKYEVYRVRVPRWLPSQRVQPRAGE